MDVAILVGAIGIVVLFLVLGAPFYVALIAGAIPVLFLLGGVGFRAIGDLATNSVRDFTLIAIPLFILLGYIMNACGATTVLFDLAKAFVGHLYGGLAMAAVIAAVMFGTMCGSAIATAVAVSSIATPRLIEAGYTKEHATAICGCSGGLGTVMPPSIGLIILGQVLRTSVADLFIAAIIPALIVTVLLCLAVYVTSRMKKVAVVSKPLSWREKREAILKAAPVAIIPLAIIGSLWGGICTPTEAAGVGCLAGLVLAKFYFKKFGIREAMQCLKDTTKATSVIFIIIVGAVVFGRALAYLQIPQMAGASIGNLGLGLDGFKSVFFILFFLMGMVFDAFILMLVALPPLVAPVINYGIALVPFGIMFELIVNLGQVTPPVALVLYSATAATGAKTSSVIREAPPYIAAWVVGTLLLLFVPAIGSIY